ncbi:DUF418 domain-containing protein [Aurantiacibacter sp. MUD11]|uniref:DUF418 domain-containing protein n=1 Tax=Aurantiacibacter sp. MUD11 TaxID=3003265 RepID=UPI0022AA7EA1|nr:DUF418 domain-containing protein [Aurantiacibacter sp. MUD11]WAT19275.1 DUF418 domain-containing protein [Aurantiacibacter sp. MUD11]
MSKYASLIVPAAPSDRFTEIDALRGFALFGILLANLPNWVGLGAIGPDRMPELMGSISLPAFTVFFNGLLDGKFYTVFSLLFGLGFSLQLDRLEAKGADGLAIFYRRMAVLLLIGLIHLSFIWSGDILTAYALLGFALPFFRRLSDRNLLFTAAVILFAIPLLGVWLLNMRNPGWLNPLWEGGVFLWEAAGGDRDADYFEVLAHGGLRELGWRAASEWAFNLTDKLDTWRFAKVLGTMLLGMWAGRKLVRGELLGNRKLLWSLFIGGMAISVPVNWIYIQQPPHAQTHWSSLIGTAPAGIAYAAGFLLVIPHLPRVCSALAAVGRMALTNYLLTSLVAGFVFYGLGLGMMGTIMLDVTYVGGLIFFGLMVIASKWWLAGHQQGPMEALWRRLTYRKARTEPAVQPAA